MKNAILVLSVIAVVILLFLSASKSKPTTGNAFEKQDLIRNEFPEPNGAVESPLKVRGIARGLWFFEASFPAVILDANGKVLGRGVLQAQREWMTEDFVPYSGEISFENSSTKNGTLVLEKDNPSGLPEHDDRLIIPISFK